MNARDEATSTAGTKIDDDGETATAIRRPGPRLWVADWLDDKIYAYDLASKARDASKDFDTLAGAGNAHPRGIWSDGTTMWVVDWDHSQVYAYNMP